MLSCDTVMDYTVHVHVASHPGGIVIRLIASWYINWVKLQPCGLPVARVQENISIPSCFVLQKMD